MSLIEEFQKSIKSPDTEEKLDLYFYRPFGFLIAKIAQNLKMTPTQLTIIGMILGVWGGIFFYNKGDYKILLVGSVLFILSGVFDSSDGQLARLTKQSSQIGLVLDGICDNLVFGAAYLAAAGSLYPEYGIWIFVLAVIGGVGHSFQSAVLDFYHREYLYFGYGKTEQDYWNPTLEELKKEQSSAKSKLEVITSKLRENWIRQQTFLSSRTKEERAKMREILLTADCSMKEKFTSAYRRHNLKMLSLWRLNGTNFHTICLLIFVFFGRFDLYLIFVDIFVLNLIMIFIRKIQRWQDEKLFSEFSIR